MAASRSLRFMDTPSSPAASAAAFASERATAVCDCIRPTNSSVVVEFVTTLIRSDAVEPWKLSRAN